MRKPLLQHLIEDHQQDADAVYDQSVVANLNLHDDLHLDIDEAQQRELYPYEED